MKLSCPQRGDSVSLQEAVFSSKNGRPVFAGNRTVVGLIIGPGMPGYISLKVVESSGATPLPHGVTIQRPITNVLNGKECSCYAYDLLEKGGHLEGYEKGKKVVAHSADKGGMSVGAKHGPEGGIKGDVAGRKIEFEDKEPVLTSQVAADQRKYQFEGEQLSAREIASRINVANGGRAFADGGQPGTDARPIQFKGEEIILTAPVSSDNRRYSFQGKELTALQVASELNVANGGVALIKNG